jgi:putative MFS transporter
LASLQPGRSEGRSAADSGTPPPSAAADDVLLERPPRWLRALPPPLWRRTPKLTRRQWRFLGLLGASEMFDHYDMALFGFAIVQIQASLAIAEDEVGAIAAILRLGAIPALAVSVLADRLGRRRLLLATVLGFTLTTTLTAFAQTAEQFAALQFLGRAFIYAEVYLAVVVVTEELSARDRGWGIGLLGAMSGLGYGLAVLLFGFIEQIPYGWRALYLIGALPLLVLARMRRALPETQRFAELRERAAGASALAPVLSLARMYPGRLVRVLLAYAPLEFVVTALGTFIAKTLQQVHGYEPWQVTVLYVVGGTLCIFGNVVAGRLSDRFGRRLVMTALIAMIGVSFLGFYRGGGWLVPLLWVSGTFALQGAGVLGKAISAELFPTSYRSTAASVRGAIGLTAGAGGLSLLGPLYDVAGSHAVALSWLIPLLAVPAVAVWLLPESSSRELEELAPER